jgi:hypothetical protein
VEPHGRKSTERSVSVVEHADDHDEHAGADVHAHGAHHVGSAAESRANRRRRRKGKHHESEDSAATAAESAWSSEAHGPGAGSHDPGADTARKETAKASVQVAPINLKAHADDPDAAVASDGLGAALIDTGRPRRRRRAASRPAGTPQSTAEAS